jgi:hypothetical protein
MSIPGTILSKTDSLLVLKSDSTENLKVGQGCELVLMTNMRLKKGRKFGFGQSKGDFLIRSIRKDSIFVVPYDDPENEDNGTGILILGGLLMKIPMDQEYELKIFDLNSVSAEPHYFEGGKVVESIGCTCRRNRIGHWQFNDSLGRIKKTE